MTGDEDVYRPERVNRDLYENEEFPEVVGFCARDDSSRVEEGDTVSYTYRLGDLVYTLTKNPDRWVIEESQGGERQSLSYGETLGQALHHALCVDSREREGISRITFAATQEEADKAVALMYYWGGYPGSWVSDEDRNAFLADIGRSDLRVLSYPKIPDRVLRWLVEEIVFIGLADEGHIKIA